MKHTKDTSRSSGKSPAPRPSVGRGIKGEGDSTTSAPTPPVPRLYTPAEMIPQGDGSLIARPRKMKIYFGKDGLTQEIGSRDAMLILGITSLGSMHRVRNHEGSKILKWRRLLPGGRKIVYTVDSVYALRAASETWGKE